MNWYQYCVVPIHSIGPESSQDMIKEYAKHEYIDKLEFKYSKHVWQSLSASVQSKRIRLEFDYSKQSAMCLDFLYAMTVLSAYMYIRRKQSAMCFLIAMQSNQQCVTWFLISNNRSAYVCIRQEHKRVVERLRRVGEVGKTAGQNAWKNKNKIFCPKNDIVFWGQSGFCSLMYFYRKKAIAHQLLLASSSGHEPLLPRPGQTQRWRKLLSSSIFFLSNFRCVPLTRVRFE